MSTYSVGRSRKHYVYSLLNLDAFALTYIEVKGEWKYLYRAVDSEGNTLDFMLSAKPDALVGRTVFA